MYEDSLPHSSVMYIQSDYTIDPDFIRSFEYYKSTNEETKTLIRDYKSEIDPDDWKDYPLKINYAVVNWISQNWTPANITIKRDSKSKSTTSSNRPTINSKSNVIVPDLLSVMSKDDYETQIQNSIELSKKLSEFPKIKYNDKIVLYRGGGPSPFTQVLRSNLKKKGNMITIYSFISTSANKNVAMQFSTDYFLYINIYKEMPLPFVSDILSLNYNLDIGSDEPTSESEVLLPIGCTFKLILKKEENINGKIVDAYYLDLIKFGRSNTRHFNSVFKSVSLKAFKNIDKNKSLSIEKLSERSVEEEPFLHEQNFFSSQDTKNDSSSTLRSNEILKHEDKFYEEQPYFVLSDSLEQSIEKNTKPVSNKDTKLVSHKKIATTNPNNKNSKSFKSISSKTKNNILTSSHVRRTIKTSNVYGVKRKINTSTPNTKSNLKKRIRK